jgi:copper homeostasis protein
MRKDLLLEVCAFNLASCIIAEKNGAKRIELCAHQSLGGTTPSQELIQQVKANLSIPIYPIIRPRGGDFLYTSDEFDEMLKSIELCKQLHCEGIATGVHLQDGEIDMPRMKILVQAAHPMKVTCHRVFDRTPNPFKALEDIINCGCERILTSGHQDTAIAGIELITDLIEVAADKIIIMPGAGVRANNIGQLIEETGAIEYHTTSITGVDEMINEDELMHIFVAIRKATA